MGGFMKYKNNRFSTSKGFKYLGQHNNGSNQYDLYAIVNPSGNIDFGARYGEEDSQYLSGEFVMDKDGNHFLSVSNITAIAAARFFANHYSNKL